MIRKVTKQKAAAGTVDAANLDFILRKLTPLQTRIAELEGALESLQEQRDRLKKSARSVAELLWKEAVSHAANAWKSARGDERLSLEWVDVQYASIPAQVITILEEHEKYSRDDTERDLMAFFEAVSEEIEGGDDE